MPRASGAGTGMYPNLARVERLAAFRANDDGIEILAARLMVMQQGAPLLSGHVDIAPMHERHYDGVKAETFGGQAIFMTGRPLLVSDLGQYELIDKLLKAVSEYRAGDPEPFLEILEPPYSQKTVS